MGQAGAGDWGVGSEARDTAPKEEKVNDQRVR